MSLSKLLIIASLFFLTKGINGQVPIIKEIRFDGLKKTSEAYLLTFLNAEVGAVYEEAVVLKDVQRLKNINSIHNASHRIDTVDQQIRVVFDMIEVRTLLPIVNFGGIEGNVWFQVGFYDANWSGKGHYFSATYQNIDRRHSGKLFYRVPRIGTSDWGFSVDINTWASREPLFFPEGTVLYDYNLVSVGASIIRRFGRRHQFEIGETFFVEDYEKSAVQTLENSPGPTALTQPKLLTKWLYQADYLNYHFFYLQGLAWGTTIQNVFNFDDNSWFNSLQIQGKYFKRVGTKGNLAFRLRIGIATNNETPFSPFVLDSNINIRGVGNRIDRGSAQLIFNTEYRHTILSSPKWGGQFVVFSDAGTWRNPGGELGDLVDPDQFRQFVGGGVRIIYQKFYDAILRIDYGIDVFNTNQRGIVIGIGQYF